MPNSHPRYAALILGVATLAAFGTFWNLKVSRETRDLVEKQLIEAPSPDYSSTWKSSGITFVVSTYADRTPRGLAPWQWHEEKLAPAILDFAPDPE